VVVVHCSIDKPQRRCHHRLHGVEVAAATGLGCRPGPGGIRRLSWAVDKHGRSARENEFTHTEVRKGWTKMCDRLAMVSLDRWVR
jgi:hypothetical protein